MIRNLSNVSYPTLAVQLFYNLNIYKKKKNSFLCIEKNVLLKGIQNDVCVCARDRKKGGKKEAHRAWAQCKCLRFTWKVERFAGRTSRYLRNSSLFQWNGEINVANSLGRSLKYIAWTNTEAYDLLPAVPVEARLNHWPLRLFYVPHGPPLSLGTGSV